MPYATGLRNFHFAKQLTDEPTGSTYETPVKLSEGVSVSVEPNIASGRLFGDNRAVATASKFNYATVNINPTKLTPEEEALLLGKTLDTDGVLKDNGGQAPYGAFGFEVTMDDGTSEYWWLLKGKFQEPSRTNNTATDSIEFGTPTLVGEFIQRESDGEWKFVGADSNTGFTAGATWFDAVYQEPTPTV
jgi:phi13 family phage major tail protein